jgi:hypothetical protein
MKAKSKRMETAAEYNSRTGRRIKDVPTVMHNNPGAIFYFDNWLGLDKSRCNKGALAHFTAVEFGIRAHVITLRNYQIRHNLATPAQIISRYAPENTHDNHTENYIEFVCDFMNIEPDTELKFESNPEQLATFAYAMHIVEAGFAWVEYGEYLKALKD